MCIVVVVTLFLTSKQLLIKVAPQTHPAVKTRTRSKTHTRLYCSHFCVESSNEYGATSVFMLSVFASSVSLIDLINGSGSLVHIETTNTLFHVKSTYAPGKRRVKSVFSFAWTTNWTTCAIVADAPCTVSSEVVSSSSGSTVIIIIVGMVFAAAADERSIIIIAGISAYSDACRVNIKIRETMIFVHKECLYVTANGKSFISLFYVDYDGLSIV